MSIEFGLRRANYSDFESIAELHLSERQNGKYWYNFFYDKIVFFYDTFPDGVWIAEKEGKFLGFIIFTDDVLKLKKHSLKKLYWLKWLINGIKGKYGFSYEMILKVLRLPLAFFNIVFTKKHKLPEIQSKIIAIMVVPEYQGKGVGSALLKKSFENLKNMNKYEVSITVFHKSEKVINLYKKIGFEVVSECLESTGKSYFMVKNLDK